MRFKKAYLEISNVCNLSCSFCPKTTRPPRTMSEDEFDTALSRLSSYVEYLYFHLLGEPLLHPQLDTFLKKACAGGFKVTVTTNGTLIDRSADTLLSSGVYKIVFSLHSFEANDFSLPLDTYLDAILSFAKSAEGKMIVVLRLWNDGGKNSKNSEIEKRIKESFPSVWEETRGGIKIGERIFIQHGDKFDWPDITSNDTCENIFCYGLRDQIGILADGTVVPCCLDNNGTVNLGNIFSTPLDEILSAPRAKAIYSGFSEHRAVEELCSKCKYSRRFK